MEQHRIALNTRMRDNYVFFDPVNPIHLSLARPVGLISRVTNSVIKGLKANTILDLDNAIDVENQCFRTRPVTPQQVQQTAEQDQELEQGKGKSAKSKNNATEPAPNK